jgi:hypothetical protein
VIRVLKSAICHPTLKSLTGQEVITVAYAPNGRAKCRQCGERIAENEMRFEAAQGVSR